MFWYFDNVSTHTDNNIMFENNSELQDIYLDSKLYFENQINNPRQKINAIVRVAPFMCLRKRKTVMKSFWNLSI